MAAATLPIEHPIEHPIEQGTVTHKRAGKENLIPLHIDRLVRRGNDVPAQLLPVRTHPRPDLARRGIQMRLFPLTEPF